MKKRSIISILIIVFCIGLIYGIKWTRADSGWDYDYDYDYGGSWDYDYDYDYDYDSSYDGNHSGFNISSLFFVAILFALFYLALINNSKRKVTKNSQNNSSRLSNRITSKSYMYGEEKEELVLSKLGMTSYEFSQLVFEVYKNIQNAWMNFDYKALRKYTTDEIYNSYTMQLDVLKTKNQKNVMDSIECIDVKIWKITEYNGIINVEVYMNVKMFDYVVSNNGHVVRGTNKKRVNIEYELTFVKSSQDILNKETKCPNCGAKIENITSGKCLYCRSLITTKPKKFVMSRKTCINQRMD